MSDQKQIAADVEKMKSSTSQAATTTADDAITSHIRLSRIFAPLMELNTNNDQVADWYDTTTINSLQSTMSSSSSSNQVSHAHTQYQFNLHTAQVHKRNKLKTKYTFELHR